VPAQEDPRPLVAADVQPGDPWGPVELLDEVDSTNAVLSADPRPWRIVVAERQRQGRGRLARTWVTTPGASLAVSTLVPVSGMPLGWVPLVAGLALAEAITETSGLATTLKWPNDVLLPAAGQRKVAGILCEWTSAGVIVGTGVNVGQAPGELPLDTATSVRAAGGEVGREALLTAYLACLAALLQEAGRDLAGVRARYAARCGTLDAPVRVLEPTTERSGVARRIDDEGRLVLQTPDGPYAVSAGDVVHVRPAVD
jgi:BirA family biotin operon repressor/biotin-[acetyl-CoA-carboxylase] ligase